MYKFCFIFLMFYFYSILGWIIECIDCSIMEKRLICNRGFLIGPYCPIYGLGSLYMYFFLNRYDHDPIVLFVMAVFGTSLLEYLTSFWMEKVFKARWWDYSKEPFNLEGRVCLKNAIAFGILGLIFVYILNPFVVSIFDYIPKTVLIVISIIFMIIFIVDNMITFVIMSKLKKGLTNLKKDSTTDLDKQIKEILGKNKFFISKIFKAFPQVKIKLPRGEKILISIYKTLDSFDTSRRRRRKRVKEIKREMKKS